MLTRVFRFRTVDKLVGKFQELEEQTIYFADAEELNDPAEGFRDLYWQGDDIVWTNLFRHYIGCLNETLIRFRPIGETSRMSPRDIPVLSSGATTTDLVNLMTEICDRVFESVRLHEFVAMIATSRHKCREEELLFYLQNLHFPTLKAIHQAHVDRNLIDSSPAWTQMPETFELAHQVLAQSLDVEEEKIRRALFQRSSWIRNEIFLKAKFVRTGSSSTNSEANQELIVCDFPRHYLKQLERLLYPTWYVACLTVLL